MKHITTSQEVSEPNRKSVQEASKLKREAVKSRWPKTDSRHWQGRLFKNSFTKNGQRHQTSDWCVKIGHQGQRHTFNLGTPNKEAAAGRALAIFKQIVGAGWEATLAEHKPEIVKKAKAATVGELIAISLRLSSARKESLDTYSKALRRITAGVIGLEDGKKYDFRRGSIEWRAKVDATLLEKLTPGAVLAWKNAFLKAAATPVQRKAAAVSVNSLLRNSKALLSKKLRPFVEKEIALPSPLWFEGVSMEKEPGLRYQSQVDAGKILQAAAVELEDKPEIFKALLLTLVCGLRRSEADSLLWEQIDFKNGTLDIRDNAHKALKSADSAGRIALDDELVTKLEAFKKDSKEAFVLETPRNARAPFTKHRSRTYRCDATHLQLIEWLRSQGVQGQRPIHTLRKEIGSIIASRDGIFSASRYLRHSDIRITSRLYADEKRRITAGLGALMAAAEDGKAEEFPLKI